MPYENLTGLKRQFWRWMLLAVLFFNLGNLVYHWSHRSDYEEASTQLHQHFTDADRYHQRRERIMDARAEAAVVVINAVSGGRTFTAEERLELSELWRRAEFDKIQQRFGEQ